MRAWQAWRCRRPATDLAELVPGHRGPPPVLLGQVRFGSLLFPGPGNPAAPARRYVQLTAISGSHEASFPPTSVCSSAMRVSPTRDPMLSLRNTWRRWNATVCVLMNS